MEFKKNLIKYGPLVSFILIIGLVLSMWILYIPIMRIKPPSGERKAIILGSANDFYRKDGFPDFDEGDFQNETTNWEGEFNPNGYGTVDNSIMGHETPGVIQLIAKGNFSNAYVDMEFIYNWTKYFKLFKYAAYNLSAWVNITTNSWTPATIIPTGAGARVGLRWLNSSNDVIRTDWSKGIFETVSGWTRINATGVADNSTLSEVTQLHLVLSVEGNMNGTDMVLFDDVKVEYWFPPPIPSPPPSNTDSDGFPAQALQVYWILKNHGYTDDNIFLMLYHTGDDIIDIYASDGIFNDLNRSGIIAEIDVENEDVNASRFKQELDISNPGSFASNLSSRDQLIIYMVDHGSNTFLGDGNATFHFEADDSYISEFEFFNLVKNINCKRILINIDICFSGNFLNQNSNIGSSWYNIPNSLLITSTTDLLSWYWRDTNNADGFAGSFFFHNFWEQLDKNKTIGVAFNLSINFTPSGSSKSLNSTQSPLIQDNLGIKDVWGFNSKPQL
ncbi:MAG: C13 family peptidase [Candidatus Thorarchaeota archaeon]